MAAVFPTLAACQENVAPGPLEIPDHILVRQTLEDCLREAMDIDGLAELVGAIESGRVTVVVRDTTEPSVLAHEILNGRPFTFLDDAPLEERRSRAIPLRRGLPVEPRELGRLDPAAIERVASQVRPDPRDARRAARPADDADRRAPGRGLAAVVRRAGRRRAVRSASTGQPGCSGAPWNAARRSRRCSRTPPWRPITRALSWPGAPVTRLTRTPPRPTCSAATWTAAARPRWRTWPRPPACGRLTPGSPWPGWRMRASPSAAGSPGPGQPRSSAPGGCWPASTPTPASGSAARSSPSPRATSCGSCSAGSTWPRAPRARGAAACSASSSSCRAMSWPQAHGRPRSWPPGWRVTGASGWTRCACPARSSGGGCRCATASPTRPRSAAGWSRPGPPRSPWPSATTCPGCSAPPGVTWRLRSQGRAGPRMSSTPSASMGRCSGPTSPRSPAACRVRSRRRCGTAWPAAWSPRTASARSGPCCSGPPRTGPSGRRGSAGCARAGHDPGPRRPDGGRCSRCPPPALTRTSWPKPSPSSWSSAGAWSSTTCWPGKTSRCPGGRSCGRCAGWRPAGPSAAAGSWPGSAASSSRTPAPSTCCARCASSGPPGRPSGSPRRTR